MSVFTNENVVTGAVDVNNFPAIQPISGTVAVSNPGLTDTELRATPVPVSIPTPVPVTDNGGSLTVDGTVAISGSVSVTGPLTDAQLRATPVPISGTVSIGAASSIATVVAVTVSTTVTTLSASNPSKTKVIIWNETGTLFVKLGSGASDTSYSYRLTANTVLEITNYTGIVTGTKLTGTTTALVTSVGI